MPTTAAGQRRLLGLSQWGFAAAEGRADMAPGLAAAAPAMVRWQSAGRSDILAWLKHSTPPEIRDLLLQAVHAVNSHPPPAAMELSRPDLFEQLLAFSDRQQRRRRGVWFTPPDLAESLVRNVDRELRQTFHLSEGLATGLVDQTDLTIAPADNHINVFPRNFRLLDPALGSGVFPLTVIRLVHEQHVAAGQQHNWSRELVPPLLARLHGREISAAALLAAFVQLAVTLEDTGFDFEMPLWVPWLCRDALVPAPDDPPYPLVLGNPPYGSLSLPGHGWIESLISDPVAGYTSVDGQPLGEKKHWLHDDYVKFLRLAQWHIQRCGYGLVAFVTSHGYLDNLTFRGLRSSLLKTFPRMSLVDLHGNALKQQRGAERDENLFGISGGIAASMLVRPAADNAERQIIYRSLRGTRSAKLAALASENPAAIHSLLPQPPNYLLVPRQSAPAEYTAWPSITDIMPVAYSIPVTARDHFVVAFSVDELKSRLEEFGDLTIPDDVIRSRYFQRTRSARYLPGDTRSWQLATARKAFAADENRLNCVREVQYRPLDRRFVAWHEALIDWPRREFCRHLFSEGNLALIVRRQSPEPLPARFFWITRTLPLDGILRSDTKGNETVLPLWLHDASGARHVNFSADWLAGIESRTHAWAGPEEHLAYVYGRFWSQPYRELYHAGIVHDFPRVPWPRDRDEFELHVARGQKLIAWHADASQPASGPHLTMDGPLRAGYPRWHAGEIEVDRGLSIATCSEEAWEFCSGAHQVLRKWLRDRTQRKLSEEDVAVYRALVRRVESTVAELKTP